MTAYYPSQAGYPVSQPVMQMGQPYGMPASYGYPGGAIGPTVVSALPATVAAPVMMHPSYGGYGYGQGYVAGYDPYSWGNRVRRFLGLAPSSNVRYQRDRSTWGFMGFSRRQRYVDGRNPHQEVDRDGNIVIRVAR